MRALLVLCLLAIVTAPAVAADATSAVDECTWIVNSPDNGLAVCTSTERGCQVEIVRVTKIGTTRSCFGA